MAYKTIDIHDAAALTIIADYPNMPEPEFESMVDELDSEEAKRLAREVRESSARLEEDRQSVQESDSDSDAFVLSVATSAGRF